jgi:PilZ domain-containing protein
MPPMALSRNFLRRRDSRQSVNLPAIVECRGVSQNVRVVDFSTSGLRIDRIKGLAAGDPVRISLTPEFALEGEIAWSVWHKAGIKLLPPLAEDDAAYVFLLDQAIAVDRTRIRAIMALAKERAGGPRPPE